MDEIVKYIEGDIFRVPLRRGGCALGVVARKSPHGVVVLGYFFNFPFGDNREFISDNEITNIIANNAHLAIRFGDPLLQSGKWPIVGKVRSWSRSHWPVPPFVRPHILQPGSYFKITYDDNDPLTEIKSELIKEKNNFEIDAMYSGAAVEIVLAKKFML